MSVRKTVMVVDGQGGGLGKAIVERLKKADLPIRIIATGTNTAATGAMLKAGADAAATGENAIIYNTSRADFIVGGVGIVAANSMMGEISPAIANAIAACPGTKLLVPVNRCSLVVVGTPENGLSEKIDAVLEHIRQGCLDIQG